MRGVIIIGNGGAALECHTLLADMLTIGALRSQYYFKGFLRHANHCGDLADLSSLEIGSDSSWQPSPDEVFVIGIGDNAMRLEIYREIKARNAAFISLISPWAYMAADASIGEASIIGIGCHISNAVRLGSCNYLNGDVRIGHGTQVGEGNFFGPRVLVSGKVTIGNQNSFGPCSVVLERAKIGSANKIAPGAFIYKGCHDNCFMSGNPALKISEAGNENEAN